MTALYRLHPAPRVKFINENYDLVCWTDEIFTFVVVVVIVAVRL